MLNQEIINKLARIDKNVYTQYIDITDDRRQTLPSYDYTTYKTEEELKAEGWTSFFGGTRTKFYHPGMNIRTEADAVLYYKFALLDNLNINTLSKKFSDLIYTSDKWSKIRGIDEIIMEPISAFKSLFEYKEATDTYTLRHNGSQKGCEIRNSVNIDYNMIYVGILQHGPINKNKGIICHLSGKPLLGINLTNFETGMIIPQYTHQLHHALYDKAGSAYKSKEPSKILGARQYFAFSHNQHMELLGCICLCGDSHDSVHGSNKKDGIDNWRKRLNIGECYSLPYHWQSEENYKDTINYLNEYTDHFKKEMAPDYETFVEMNSTPYLAVLRSNKVVAEAESVFSTMFGEY
jgi:hypothetical protein